MSKKAKNEKNYHNEVARVSAGVVKFFEKTFSEVRFDGPDMDPLEVQKSPIMFVGTHRSHADYFLIGSKFCLMGFRNIRFAAGDNLTKLPWIGPKFLTFGAFAVSRDSGFERHYVRNLCAKVIEMLNDGDSVLVFPEGGRSYSGGMLEIRGGILNAALMLQAANPERDVFLLPTAVSYERPPDVPWFSLLLKGKKLRKGKSNFIKKILGNLYYFGADLAAFAPFMLARFFGRKYGAAYMDYGKPVSVRSLVDLEANRIQGARDEFAAHRASLDIAGAEIRKLLVSLYRILPVHIVSALLLRSGDGTVSMIDLVRGAGELKSSLVKDGRNCKTLDELTPATIVKNGLATLHKLKAVKVNTKAKTAAVRKSDIVNYFAATIAINAEN
ncbi:MAG: 1-acyl-sn-glycerol-3-phosphate acyltransferase [Chitinispirillales bacterium]|nr:1-acyl-sn-glycerol-3-phosphate acyltransferase [Chitinispirillales bacterium]